MNYTPTISRRRILQIVNDQYQTGVSDKALQEALKSYMIKMSVAEIRAELGYLASLENPALAIQESADHDMTTAHITAHGVDYLSGAEVVPGVYAGNPANESLPFKKDIRRGILSYLKTNAGKFVEDFLIRDYFEIDGHLNLTIETIQKNLWYLSEKKYIDALKIGGGYTAKITPAGVDVFCGDTRDVGVTANGR